MDESREEIGPSASQNKISQGDPTTRLDLEDADRRDSDTNVDRTTLFQFKTPGNSYELR